VKYDPKDYPPGSIVVPIRDDLARYHQAGLSMMALQKPEGTRLTYVTGMSVAHAINRFIRQSMHGDWLYVTGDDHILPADSLLRMLSHDVDWVSPLCFTRRSPFFWTIFREKLEDDRGPRWITYEADEVPTGGLFKVNASGGGFLIKRRVLDALADPWIENSDTVYQNEDLVFCDKVRNAGFDIWVDLDVKIGHLGTFVSNPVCKPGDGWGVLVEFAGSPTCVFLGTVDQRRDWMNETGEYADDEWRPNMGADASLQSRVVVGGD
jgi:hypothetical protein